MGVHKRVPFSGNMSPLSHPQVISFFHRFVLWYCNFWLPNNYSRSAVIEWSTERWLVHCCIWSAGIGQNRWVQRESCQMQTTTSSTKQGFSSEDPSRSEMWIKTPSKDEPSGQVLVLNFAELRATETSEQPWGKQLLKAQGEPTRKTDIILKSIANMNWEIHTYQLWR